MFTCLAYHCIHLICLSILHSLYFTIWYIIMDSAPCFGYAIDIPPSFHDMPFDQWKFRFKIFARSIDIDIWKIIDGGYFVPNKAKSKWNKNGKKLFALNKKLINILLKSFNDSISNKFAHFDSANTLWKYIGHIIA